MKYLRIKITVVGQNKSKHDCSRIFFSPNTTYNKTLLLTIIIRFASQHSQKATFFRYEIFISMSAYFRHNDSDYLQFSKKKLNSGIPPHPHAVINMTSIYAVNLNITLQQYFGTTKLNETDQLYSPSLTYIRYRVTKYRQDS